MRVAVLYNLKRDRPGLPHEAEYDSPETVAAICGALESGGHAAEPLEADLDLWARLRREPFDFAFNVAEGLRGEAREAHVPAMLEMLGLPYTGSRPICQATCLDKPTCKRLLKASGIPTPRFLVAAEPPQSLRGLRPPYFVKPAGEGSSVGVTEDSLCESLEQVREQVARVLSEFGEAALVEEFLPGRELTVGLVGNPPLVLPVTEINYAAVPAGYPPVYTYHFKQAWGDDGYYLCPAPLARRLLARVRRLAVAAFTALGCADVARIDLRLDGAGAPQVIEVNPLPGLAPGWSDLPRQAAVAGWRYERLIGAILDAAVRRWRQDDAAPHVAAVRAPSA